MKVARLDGGVFLVAGGSGGIGGAVVSHLRDRGAQTISWSRSRKADDAWLSVEVDCINPDEVTEAMRETMSKVDRIDGLVHCIGDIYDSVPIPEMDLSRFQRSYDLCVGSALLVTQACYPHICESGGSAVYLSSVASIHPYPGIADYCAAKAGLEAFARSLAVEFAPFGARANCVSPAVVDTPLFGRGPYTVDEANDWHALKRIGQPEEIASLIGWLLSPESSWMTGTTIKFDGGMSLA